VIVDFNAPMSDAQWLKTAYTYDGVQLNGDSFKAWATVLTPYLYGLPRG
tara:strand:+ start:195 stop:341 length:147 start_codon:yes stop_codon:yes gene_type:complete